jgi:predicted dehydrogenase
VTIIPTIRASSGPTSHEALVIEAVRSLREGTPPPSDGQQGLAAVQVLQAMYESALSRQEIALMPDPAR